MSDVVLISTAEFALKSQPVRHQLARQLKHHIRFSLKRIGQEGYRIRPAGGLLVIDGLMDADPVANSLARVLGVSHADACERTATDPSEIVECVVKLAERTIKHGETFAVRARRFEPSQLKGKEIEIRAGSEILSRLPKGVSVNLDSPDHTFRVFYGASDAYISARRFNGPSGLPVGSQGSLLGLATDPACAPLSFYLLMKRGAMVWPVIADLPPPIGGVPPDEILQGLRRLRQYVPKNTYSARLITLDEATRNALAAVSPDLQRVFCMRLVFRAAKHLAQNALGLVTADRFCQGDVESLKDLRAADEVATFPVYRPLLTLDEADMREQLEELGLTQPETEKTATQPLSGADEALIDEARTLENRLQAEQLAHKIAADSRKMQIDFP
ncbi:THUMP domain-containing protein [Candidatus Bathyarchaeota archaeon]|nr:THUMP domain-containing protein [Candidatus Bathyarchaeota archaeon]